MTSGYFKVAGYQKVRAKRVWDTELKTEVQIPARRERLEEYFFFDVRSPDAIRRAFQAADSAFRLLNDARALVRLSVFGDLIADGPWAGIPMVGEGIGELDEVENDGN